MGRLRYKLVCETLGQCWALVEGLPTFFYGAVQMELPRRRFLQQLAAGAAAVPAASGITNAQNTVQDAKNTPKIMTQGIRTIFAVAIGSKGSIPIDFDDETRLETLGVR